LLSTARLTLALYTLLLIARSQPALVSRAMHKQVLVAHEVHTVLRTLVVAGKVSRVEGSLGEGEDEYDWERDHWALDGCVWR